MNSKRRNFRLTFAAAVVLLLAILFALMSVVGNMRGARMDLTSDKLFTMSPAAVEILQKLQVPVQVKLYITPSEKMPTQYRNLERDLTEQLRNFEGVSDGMLQFSVFNPQNDEEMQQTLAAKGIQPFQVQSVEKDEIGVKLIWSAVTIAYKDKPEEVLPRVLPQNLAALEQDIISPIFRLTREKTPKIAYYGPKREMDRQMAMMYLQQGMQPPEPQDQYARLSELLSQGHYEAVPIQLTKDSPIPDDADMLIVMAIAPMNDRQVYEINRALRRGLPVVMGVQAHEYGYSPAQSGGWTVSGQNLETGVEDMLAQFGLTVNEDHFMDASSQVISMPREVNMGGLRMRTNDPVNVPIQIRVTETQMYQDSPLVNRIGEVFYLWGTPIDSDAQKLSANGLELTTLIESSDNVWRENWSEGMVSPTVFDQRGKNMLGAQPLAVMVEGIFPDTFSERDVPAWPVDPAAAEEMPLDQGPDLPTEITPAPGRLFLIGNARMFDDSILAAAQNALLLLNSVDYLAGSQDLLAIRSKVLTNRVIKPVEAGQKMVWRIIVVLLVPVALAAFGIIRAGMRRKEAAIYRQQLRRSARAAQS